MENKEVYDFAFEQVKNLFEKEFNDYNEFTAKYGISVLPHGLLNTNYMYNGKPLDDAEFKAMFKKWQDEKDNKTMD